MLRELKEETKIQIPKDVLRGNIVSQRVFDHPDRSLRGRTITHGFCIHLRDGELAQVEGADDADKAFWIPLADLYEHEDKFFEDHVHIIRYFTNRF
jgi:bifunctional NMN adenylyltransferase/nudix hydrolase